MSREDDLISRHFAGMAGPAGLGLRDDAALVAPPAGCDLVATTDAVVAGVHFFAEDPPQAIAKKALRVNLSDLAAKGAEPLGFLLALALPPGFDEGRLASFAGGLAEDSRAFACPLIGGDTVSTPGPLTIAITALGSVPQGAMVPRDGARPGDRLYVTGTVGDAALGLALRQGAGGVLFVDEQARAHLLDRYLLPRPRLALRAALLRCAHAAMDISDGLVGDLTKMLRLSGVGGRVWLADTPLSSAARALIDAEPSLFDAVLTGGDDYEILAAIPPEKAGDFETEAAAAQIAVACLGEALADGKPPCFEDADGRPRSFAQPSYSHF